MLYQMYSNPLSLIILRFVFLSIVGIGGLSSAVMADCSSQSDRDVSIFAGSIYIDGNFHSELVHDAMSAPEGVSAKILGRELILSR